jgi:HlyD family secretion protein
MTEKNAGNRLFRKVALERLSLPEQLDQLMRITSPRGWLALLAIGLLLACGILWGLWGSIPTKVEGSGILMSRGGIFSISARASGSVQAIRLDEGDEVEAGQVVVIIGQPDIRDKILAANNKVRDLKTQYQQHRAFSEKEMALEEHSIAEQCTNLLQTNKSLNAQLKLLKKRLKDQERLVELGLITRMKVLDTRIEIDSRAEKIRQNNNQIKQLSIQKLQDQNDIREERLDQEGQIQIAQDELQGLQHSLRMDSKAISVFTGRVISVDVALGDVVQTGSRLMTIEKTGQHSRFLQAILYVPANQGKKIVTGMKVHVSPSTVKKDQYGSIMGLVTYVSAFPANREAMKRALLNEKMVEELSKSGPPIEVKVALVPDSRTYSWYKWTSSDGPPLSIHAGTMCTATAIVKRQPPIQLVIPLMKKYLMGVGENPMPWGE